MEYSLQEKELNENNQLEEIWNVLHYKDGKKEGLYHQHFGFNGPIISELS
jgi:hypothetical protein